MPGYVVTVDQVDKTISAFTRLDKRGDRKAMTKLAQRVQKEQPFLLQFATTVRAEHGDKVGEAAVFYTTLIWAMFARGREDTLPRLTQQNLADADRVVTLALAADVADKPPHERVAAALVATQPHIYGKLVELIAEDVKENAMAAETAAIILKPTEVVIEAFDAAVAGRRPGERQGTIVADEKTGRNEPCPCGSGKKFKKCHGEA
jgi:hypothetical protein